MSVWHSPARMIDTQATGLPPSNNEPAFLSQRDVRVAVRARMRRRHAEANDLVACIMRRIVAIP